MNLFIDDKKSSIEEVKTRLGLKQHDVPFTAISKIFKRRDAEKFDPITKRPIIPSGMAQPASFRAIDKDGESITIRYVVSNRQRPGSSYVDTIYAPISIPFIGLNMHVEQEQKVLFFFLFVNPANKQSPLNKGKANPPYTYEFIDKSAQARDEAAIEDLLFEAMTAFKALAEPQLRQLAKGYAFENVDSLSIFEVQSLIRGKVKASPEAFLDDLSGNEVALRGIVQDSIDKGILQYDEIGGMKHWTIQGRDLVKTKPGENEVTTLAQIVRGDMEGIFTLLDEGLESAEAKTTLQKPEISKFFDKFKPDVENPHTLLTKTDEKAVKEGAKNYVKGEYYQSQEYQDKLEKWALTDLSDPDVHFKTREAITKNAEAVQAKREELIAAGREVPKVPETETA